jgi:hypothetical protein
MKVFDTSGHVFLISTRAFWRTKAVKSWFIFYIPSLSPLLACGWLFIGF